MACPGDHVRMNLPDFEVKWPCHEAAILPWHGVKAGQERLPVLSSKQTSAWLEVELPPETHLLARSSSTEDPHHEICELYRSRMFGSSIMKLDVQQ